MKGRTNHSVGRILLGAKRAAAICAARIGKGYARAGEKYRVVFPDGRYRTWISRIAFHGTAAALILALIIPIQSLDILAAGVYTSSATDADGNTFLAHNTVNDTAYYDTTQDSSPEVQRQLGVDPNWPNGVTRKSSALKFDGTDDRIDFGNIGIHNIGTGSMSWSLWFKAAPSTDGVLLRKSGANNLNGVLIQVLNVSGQVQARLGDSTGSATIALLSGAGYNDGAWHHLALTFDRSSSAILYIDNAVVTSSSSRPLIGVNMVPSATLTMAANSTYGSPLNGVLDDPRIYSRVLTAEEISQLFSRNGISEAGLVGQWKFDESSCEGASPCYVRDTSPYGNSGTLLDNGSNGDGATTGPLFVSGANSIVDGFKGCGPEDVGCVNPSGRSGAGNVSVTADTSTASDSAYEVQVTNSPAVQFDGTDDYVSLPTVTGATHAALSYSFWFSTTNISPSGGAVLFRSRNSTSTEVTLLAGKIRFQHGFSTTGGVFETAAIISTNTWYHVVVAYNNSSVSNVPSIFINGDPVAVTVATAPVGTASVNWGNSGMSMGGGAATMYLAGKIDDARVFSRVLTAAEAKALYVGNPVSNLSILGWWKMDEGTGTSAEDATGNGVTGTLTNGPTWVEGYSSAGAVSAGDPSDSPVWAMPGYQFREQVKVANASGSTLPTGYSVNAPTSRATKLNANQTRADGNDWRMVHQPTDATRSLSFDGSNDDVTIPYSSLVDFDYNNPFTVSVWMKAGATQANTGLTYNYIAQRRLGAAGSQSFYLAINNQGAAIPGTIRAGRYESGHNPEITSTKTLNDSKWHLLTFTKVSSTLTLYIDGVAEASTTDTTTTDTSDVTDLCWAASCTSGRWFQGGLDDARVYNKGLSASEAAALYSGGSGSTGAVTSGLVGWWRFDEGSGQVLQDSSGNGLHGLVGDTSASTTTDPSWSTDGVVSTAYEVPRHIPKAHALRFDLADGTSEDSVGFSDNNAADIRTGSMSWSMWFRAAASGADQILYRKADSSFAKGCVIKLTTSNALQLSCGNTAGTLLATITTTQTTYTNGSWYHVTGVLNRATQELGLYVNGQLVQTGSAANLSTDDLNAASFFQLSGRSGSSDYFNGWMSDVRVYNYALPTGKINQIYNGGQGTVGVPESGLVAGWRLDEGTGTSVADYSGNAITGTLKSDQVTTGNGTSAGPIWQANLAPTASTTQTYFQTIAPIANSANSTDYYLYYGKADEKGSAFASPQPTRTGLLFDGTDDTVSVADNDTLDIGTGSMTWSLWFKSSTSGTVKYLYRKAGTNGTGGMLLSIGSGDKLTAQVRDSGGFSSYFATSTVSVTDGNWHLATAVVDRTANFLRVYVDGGNVVSTDISILTGDDLNTSASVILGGSSTVYHNGSMDDVQVHSRALSATEIADSYANAAPVSSANKVLHWKMDEGTGSTLTDSTATGLTGALNSFNFTPSSGWVHNENLWKASSAPTITAFSSDSEVPRFFQYRAVTNPVAPSGSWSALQPIGMAPVALGATGVKLKWNPVGMYRRYDTFAVSSWVVEAYSTSSPQRGKRRSFPEKANIVGNDSAVDIIDAQTNKLWMRIPGGVGTTQLSTVPVKQVAALNGRLYVTKTSANHTQVVDLQTDIFRTHHSSGNAFGTVAIAGRAGSGTGTYAGSALSSGSSVTNVAVQVLGTPPKTYVAYGINGGSTSSGVDVVVNETANTRHGLTTTDSPVRHYALAANSTYKSVLLTSAGTLYAANGTAGGVDRWDTIQSDTGDQVGTADRTYSTASTPALRNNTVNSLSVSTGTSQADYTSNTLAVGTSVGVDLVSEHTSQASSIITRYTPTGSVGTSKWNSEGFGGVVDFTGSSAVNIPHSTVFDPGVADFTAEGWFKTTQSCASSCMLIQRRNGAAGILVNLDSSNYLSASVRISTTDYTTTSLATVNDGIWHHFALVRVGTSISQYLDGVLQQITTNAGISASISNTDALRLGRNGTTGNNFNGYLDEVRLSNSARYTAAFTPSNREFVVDANTLGLWHLNNPAGQYVMDASTNANHGTVGTDNTVSSDDPYLVSPSLAGTAKVSAVALLHSSDTGKGLSFDGSADYVSVPDNANLDFAYNQDFSVGVWIKAPSTQANTGTTYNNIIHKWNGSGVVGYPYTLRIQNQTSGTAGKITAFRSDDLSNNPSLSSTVTVNDNLWHHVAFVKSGSTLRLYVDGVANGSTTDTTTGDTTNASPLTIGARGTNYFQGSLDEVRIYSAALSGANVAALYNGGRGWNGSPETGLVGGWHFNEGSGQTVADHSATANGGTLGADSTASSDDPTWITSSPVRSQPMLWVATNDAAADDGGITAVSLISNRRVTSFSTSDSSLPDNDVTSLSVGTGGLALTGTEAGAWSVGAAGAALDPAYLLTLSSATDARIQLPAGTIRLKDGTIHLK